MILEGKVIDCASDSLTIKVPFNVDKTIRIKPQTARVLIEDSRACSFKQKAMCHILLQEIADYSGESKAGTEKLFKHRFAVEQLEGLCDDTFSLSSCSVGLANGFLQLLIDFCIEWDIPTKHSLLEYVEPNFVESYIYKCIVNKKCAICGKRADLHHMDAVGMGRDRDSICHIGMKAISLCREHHTEFHSIGEKMFDLKYHVGEGVEIDKNIAKLYKLKSKGEN